MRKLTTAINKNNERIHIDSYNREDSEDKFFCPYCKEEVIPKQGNNKVWHFSHKGKSCNLKSIKENEKKSKEISLNDYMSKTINTSQYNFSKSNKFLCPFCHDTHLFENGVNWSGQEYICKKCFTTLTPEQVRCLMQRNQKN